MLLDTDQIAETLSQRMARRTGGPFRELFPEPVVDLNDPADRPELDFWGNDEDDNWWLGTDTDKPIMDAGDVQTVTKTASNLTAQPLLGSLAAKEVQNTPSGFTEKIFNARRWMADHENGLIPQGALDPIGGGHFLRPDAAQSWVAMRRAARRDGVTIGSPTDSYRTLASQKAVAQEKGLYKYGGLAAVPGTSDHGWGIAVDTAEQGRAWIAQHGQRFGWVNDTPGEDWHFGFKGWKGSKNAFREPVKKDRTNRKKRNPRDTSKAASKVDLVTAGSDISSAVTFSTALGAMFADEAETLRAPTSQRQATPADLHSAGKVPKYVPRKYRDWVLEAARKYDLDPRLVAAVGKVESGWSPNVNLTSSAGAMGPMQIMPFWQGNVPYDIGSYKGNIFAGALILRNYIKQSKGSIRTGLAKYNGGPANPQYDYADLVLGIYRG